MKKRVLTLLLLLLLTVGLVGCKKGTKTTKESTTTTTEDITPTETVTKTKVVVYDGPSILESSSDIGIKVEDKDLFVYETLVNHGRLFTFTSPQTKNPVAIFDFEGRVQVTITVNNETINSAVVRPLKYDVEPVINGNTISFTLEYPANYVIEYNGNTEKAVHLFANPLEKETPDPLNIPDNMIYIGPGVYKADAIPVESNQTVYISGGAVVYGQIRAEGVENVTIRGRGIIDGSIYPRQQASEYTIPIEFRRSKNITIEGITFLNPAGWTITSYFNDDFKIENIKIITARPNGDGISIQSSKNVLVKNSFVRTWDDSLVVKNYDRGTSDNIRFENMVLWTDLAQSMEIGYETYGETINNVVFRDITVLHNFHKPVMSIHNSDDAKITNVVYQNITVEDARMVGDDPRSNQDDFLIDFNIQYNQSWTKSGGVRGSIDDVTIDNVLVLDGKDDNVSRISGYDKNHKVTNVTINNLTYKGILVDDAKDINLTTNDHTSDISINSTKESTGARLLVPYILEIPNNSSPEITVVNNVTQSGLIVPEFSRKELPQVYMGNQVTGNFTASATHGNSTLVWDDGTGSFEDGDNVASNVLDDDTATTWVGKSWTNEPGEYATLRIIFDSSKKIGTIRVYGDASSQFYTLQNIAVYGVKSTSSTGFYTKVLNAKDYEFSPSSGFYADIKIKPDEFSEIQLRFYNKGGFAYPDKAFASEIEFYPASLTFSQAATGSAHEDVYVISNITDGNPLTYYESEKGVWPAQVVIDLSDTYDIKYISIYLPPLMQWTKRTQTFTIYASSDGNSYQEIVPENVYTFDPKTGNVVEIELENSHRTRYIKFVFTANSSLGGEGAQISEISIFE